MQKKKTTKIAYLPNYYLKTTNKILANLLFF